MQKYFIFIFTFLYILPAHALFSYSAKYDLYGQTDLGNIKFGIAEYELVLSNNAYVFRSHAKTNQLWSSLYDYSINETSIGLIEDSELIGDYYKIIENQGDSISDDYEINIYSKKGYVSLNGEVMSNGFIKTNLEKLSDSELILKAIESGYFERIKFAGNQANDINIPSFEKDLANKHELIKVLLEPKLDVNSTKIVDTLSIYLHISEDIQKYPNQKVFTYQVVDKKGLFQREFIVNGLETINIANNEIETIRIECPELRLTFNISKDHNFMPVSINKTNGKTNFQLILSMYTEI